MKKILIGFALSMATLSFAQQYPNNNGYENNGYNDGYGNNNGYGNSNDGSYSDQDDQNYFPDDYYYNYPQDYYQNDYYQSNYNDYRNSIVSINWNGFFAQNRLNQWQIDQVLRLNNLYVSFSTWNNFYRYNPDRWYYDRFYALQRIMGPRVFVAFQNNYYRGYSPVVYFQNYRRTHYASICRPISRYRNVNINIYRVDRNNFRRMNNPSINIVRGSDRPNNGFRGSVRDGNNGGFRNQAENRNNNNNSGFRNDNNGVRNNGGFRGSSDNGGVRNNGGFRTERAENTNNGGVRNGGGFREGSEVRREEAPRRENNGGGFRNEGGSRRSENSAPRQQNNRGGERSGGFRTGFAKN